MLSLSLPIQLSPPPHPSLRSQRVVRGRVRREMLTTAMNPRMPTLLKPMLTGYVLSHRPFLSVAAHCRRTVEGVHILSQEMRSIVSSK